MFVAAKRACARSASMRPAAVVGRAPGADAGGGSPWDDRGMPGNIGMGIGGPPVRIVWGAWPKAGGAVFKRCISALRASMVR